jgi:hypothetical protein
MNPAAYAPAPRSLWIELTSKCPADCIFCSRKLRRGAGEHLSLGRFDSLVGSMVDARRIVLNYSVYPDLIPAIGRARETGAYVELVSVLVMAPMAAILYFIRGDAELMLGVEKKDVSAGAFVHNAESERLAAASLLTATASGRAGRHLRPDVDSPGVQPSMLSFRRWQ